jgi:signal transduction histidine kinase
VLIGALGVWSLAVGLSPDEARLTHVYLPSMFRNLASGLFLVAGVVRLACWRLTGDPYAARRSIALLIMGTSIPAVAIIGPLLHEPAQVAQSAPSTRALLLIPVFALLLPGRNWSMQSVRRPIPMRYAAAIVLASGALVAALVVIRLDVHATSLPTVWQALGSAVVLGWATLAVRSWLDASREPHAGGHWPAIGFTLLAACDLERVFAVDGVTAVVGIAAAFQLSAAAVLVTAAARDLRAYYRSDGANAADLSRALVGLQRHLAEVEQLQRDRLHDARTAVVGVIGASELLTAGGAGVDADVLRSLMLEELHRLQSVLDTQRLEPITRFDLAEALEPVVRMHQLDGLAVRAELTSVPVVGRPDATATVLDNLLRNARVHAPGARVVVRTMPVGAMATVVVEDNGPGIPADEIDDVLLAGVRGSAATAPGDGLGLYTSVAAMRAQGGALRLGVRNGGGTRVTISLPAAEERGIDQAKAS